MTMHRAWVAAISAALTVGLFAGPAVAFEFEMTGGMTWTYEFYNQQGSDGFFGPYNVDNSGGATPTTTANLNFWWNGARLAQNLVTGHDASRSYFYVLLDPTIKVNNALRFKARCRLGQWGNPQAGYYNTQDAPGTDNAFSEAQFTMWWATAQTPLGMFAIGKRPWKFGTGLQYDGSDGLTTESMVLNAPYGPFDLGVGFYAHRPARGGATITADPYDLIVITDPVTGGVFDSHYFNHADKSGAIKGDVFAYMVYNSGALQTGALAAFGGIHVGPEGRLVGADPIAPGAVPALSQDAEYLHGTLFAKYNNGRFFFNAEAAWVYWSDRLSGPLVFGFAGPPLAVPALLPTHRDTEQWRYMVETGVMAGPAKLSLLAAWSPGPDRRNYALTGKQSALFVWHPTFDTFLANYDVFRPYSFLFTYNYGSGINAYNLSLDGHLRDALVLSGRLDYAAAANVNVYGTFLWAERTSDGYGWACIAPNDAALPGQFTPTANNGNLQFVINGAATAPNIPRKARALGWEVDAGVDWQLLEGWTVGFLAAYWQPGRWFSYACIDRSVVGWNTFVPTAANNYGTRPDKHIDPIIAGQVTMGFSF